MPYTRAFAPDAGNRAVCRQILNDLNLLRAFNAHKPGDEEGERLIVDRNDPMAHRRITYYPGEKKLLIEKRATQTPHFLTCLHSSVGYGGSFQARRIWAAGLDLSISALCCGSSNSPWIKSLEAGRPPKPPAPSS